MTCANDAGTTNNPMTIIAPTLSKLYTVETLDRPVKEDSFQKGIEIPIDFSLKPFNPSKTIGAVIKEIIIKLKAG